MDGARAELALMEETGWLIERNGPTWWAGRTWSRNSLEAVRFAREVDALRMINADPITFGADDVKPTHHVWTPPGINPPEDSIGDWG